jgi:PAS domain S-box-containing protein
MKRFSFGSLRVRLILLVLLAVIPALGITLYSGLELRDHMRQGVLVDALRLAKDISETHDRLIQNARQILFTLSKTSEVQQQDKAACIKIFADIVKQFQGYTALVAIKPNGDQFASNVPITRPINYSDRPWFQRLLKTRDFVIGEYLIGRVSGKPLIVLAHPVFDDIGNLKAILGWGMDLEWLNKTLVKNKLQEGTSVSVIDSDGTVLFRYPEPEKFVGKSMPETSIVKAMLAKHTGVEETVGIDGIPRLFGFTSLGKGVESVHVTVGIPKQIALATADRVMKDSLAYLGLIALLALAAAWFMGGYFIVHPVNRLLDTTKQLANGDLTVRTGPPYGQGEIGQLALAFDQMVTSLEQREAERKRAEEMLVIEKQRFETLSKNAPFGMVMIDQDGTFKYINPKFRELFGYDLDDVPNGKTWFRKAFPDPKYRHEVISTWLRDLESIKPGEKRNRIFTVTCKDGTEKIINLIPVQLETGENLMTYEDITERKRAEEALRKSGEKFRELFDNAPVGYHEFDIEGRITNVNRTELEMLGYTLEERIGQFVWRSIKDEEKSRQIVLGKLAGVIPPSKALERTYRRKDGTTFPVLIQDQLLLDEKGRITGMRSTIQDITERKRAEDALRESEEKYRTILENIEDGYFEVDIAGNFTFFNDSMCRIYGYPREELMGMNDRQYTDQENAKKLFQGFNKVYKTGEPSREFDWEITRKDGTKRSIESSVSLIKDLLGNRMGFRGIVRDVTERKRIEQEKTTLEEQLRQSQKIEAIGRLAGGIAHDFNNLLTVIKGYSQLSLHELKEDVPLRENIEEIKRAAERAADLTRQLLAFSRRQILEMKVLDLNTILRDMDKMLHRLIGEDIELITLLADDLGGVKTDPGWVEQIIMNLAVNARDAMPSVGKLTIETANVELDEHYARAHVAVTPGRYAMLSVSDTGVGMPPEIRDKVFEPFFTTREKGKGTGLGLSTVYGIVKQSGGNIWVYSEPGYGTTFKIYLPRVDEPLEEIKERVVKEELPRGSETILIVEDEEDVLKLAARILERQGYTVLQTSSTSKALEICKEQKKPIHLILTDVVMPQMGGRELADRIVSIHPETKVLYMSGYTDNAIVHHGVLEEGLNFMQKPFTLEILSRKVREALDK